MPPAHPHKVCVQAVASATLSVYITTFECFWLSWFEIWAVSWGQSADVCCVATYPSSFGVFSLIDWIADTHPQGDTDVQSLVKCPGLIVLWHASRMTAALCASVQNYTDDAMPENDCIMACV